MKTKAIIPLVLLSAVASSSAFTVAFSSLDPFHYITTPDAIIPPNVLPTLVAEGSGFVAVGFFTTLADVDLATSTTSVLGVNFVQFGASTTFGAGFYDGSADGGRIGAASQFLNKNIYTVLANESTIASSTQLAIFKSNLTFTQDDALAIPTAVTAAIDVDGQFLMGASGPDLDYGSGSFGSVALQTAVPEPSALLLSSLGVMVLARRKR
jgi:hypothetical protein